jgi:hypothetical protein
MNTPRCGWRCVAFAAALCLPLASFAAPADEIKALSEAGHAADAYALGKRHPEALGQPAFDFFFGAAAIEAGHAAEGVLALERYLLAYPDNGAARQLLARGYYVLGEDGRAREEFESLRKLNPPPDVAAAIDRYLDSIRLRQERYSLSAGAYVELGFGHDTNVNAGPAAANIFVPGFGVQPLAVSSQKSASNFESLGAGGYVNYPVKPGIALFVQGQGERKFHTDADTRQFEVGNYNAAGGVSVLRNQDLFRVGLSYGLVTLASNTFRRATGGSVEWQHQFDDRQSLTFGAQLARFKYSTTESRSDDVVTTVDNSPRDADFHGVSALYKRVLGQAWEPTVTLGVNAGDQRSRTGHPELVPRSWGASASINLTPAPKWGLLAALAYQQSDYHGPDFFAQPDARHDKYSALNVALTYLYSRHVSVRGEALFSRNRSNADAYAFPRNVYSVKVRYEFK